MTQPAAKSYTDYLTEAAGITSPATTSYGVGETTGARTAESPAPSQVTQTTEPETAAADTTSTTSTITPITPTTKAGENYGIDLGTYWGSPEVQGTYKSLFQPIGEDVTAAGEGLKGATQDFLKGAGQRRTWESIGGQGILDQVITGARPTQEAIDLGKASYTGTGLAQDTMDKLTPKTQELSTWQEEFKSPANLTQELLATRTPTLTSGELRFEGGRLGKDEGYLAASKAAQDEISKLLGDYTRAQGEAQGIASQKAQDESGIAKNTGEYLQKRAGDYSTDWGKDVDAAKATNQAATDAWNKFLASGAYSDLAQVPGDTAGFNTSTRQGWDQAQAAKAAIMDDPKYAGIADVPLMTLGTSGAGHELLKFPDDWWSAHQGDHTEAEWKSLKALARERQKALDAQFTGGRYGSKDQYPDVYTEAEDPNPGRYTAVTADPETGAKAGQYSEIWNPYFDEGYTLPALADYLQFSTVDPTRESVATDPEIEQYNRIQDILGELALATPDTVENGADWTAPQVSGDAARYQATEAEQAAAHKQALLAEQKAWQQEVQGTRKKKKGSSNLIDQAVDLVF